MKSIILQNTLSLSKNTFRQTSQALNGNFSELKYDQGDHRHQQNVLS